MGWFNYLGLIFVLLFMVPNIFLYIRHKEEFSNVCSNKTLCILEQIGRYGSIFSMIINIPFTYFNYWFPNDQIIYIILGAFFLVAYYLVFITYGYIPVLGNKILLVWIPTFLFFLSGLITLNVLLLMFSLLFGVAHYILTIKNQ